MATGKPYISEGSTTGSASGGRDHGGPDARRGRAAQRRARGALEFTPSRRTSAPTDLGFAGPRHRRPRRAAADARQLRAPARTWRLLARSAARATASWRHHGARRRQRPRRRVRELDSAGLDDRDRPRAVAVFASAAALPDPRAGRRSWSPPLVVLADRRLGDRALAPRDRGGARAGAPLGRARAVARRGLGGGGGAAALGAALATAFPAPHVIVALEAEEGGGCATGRSAGGDAPVDRRRAGAIEIARLGFVCERAAPRARGATPSGLSSRRLDEALAAQARVGLRRADLTPRRAGAIGSVTLLLPRGQALDEADEALVAAHTDHAARALTRARRHEREHDVAVALQRSLLPEELRRSMGSSSRGATSRAASGSRSAATGTTRCAGPTASSTSPSATSPGAASRPPC